jgi:DNA-binding transcriptional MerR regulator/effector-binding domain-containing protein
MMKLKIGEFGRVGQVSVQTLRYYDNLGLLKPAEVDRFSGYRYYSFEQLPRLNRILALKDLGFSLDQVAHMLDQDLPSEELKNMLHLKQTELRGEVQTHLDRLERIEARLELIAQGDHLADYEVVVKPVPAMRVASVRGIVPTYWDVGPLWARLAAALEAHKLSPTGPWLTLCHAPEPETDLEVCAPVEVAALQADDLTVHELPAIEIMACTIHHGPFTGLAGGFAALLTWVHANDCQIVGPDREIYLRLPERNQESSDKRAITELQFPVQLEPAGK